MTRACPNRHIALAKGPTLAYLARRSAGSGLADDFFPWAISTNIQLQFASADLSTRACRDGRGARVDSWPTAAVGGRPCLDGGGWKRIVERIPLNWAPHLLPAAGDALLFTETGAGSQIALNGSFTAGSFAINATNSLTMDANNSSAHPQTLSLTGGPNALSGAPGVALAARRHMPSSGASGRARRRGIAVHDRRDLRRSQRQRQFGARRALAHHRQIRS